MSVAFAKNERKSVDKCPKIALFRPKDFAGIKIVVIFAACFWGLQSWLQPRNIVIVNKASNLTNLIQ